MDTRAHSDLTRSLLSVRGADARPFLQGLVTNDVGRLDGGAVYAALLSPQGKYLFDFVLVADGDAVLIDVKADRAAALAQRLALYKLRSAVEISADPRGVVIGRGPAPEGVLAAIDPRDARLGWRAYVADPASFAEAFAPLDPAEVTRARLELVVPETGIELMPDEAYVLEMGFERLNGVDFRKGCYVGQEVTARMKHKTDLRKGLARVRVEGSAPPPGTELLADGKAAGTLYTAAEGLGLAHLRFDRAGDEMRAGAARVTRIEEGP